MADVGVVVGAMRAWGGGLAVGLGEEGLLGERASKLRLLAAPGPQGVERVWQVAVAMGGFRGALSPTEAC